MYVVCFPRKVAASFNIHQCKAPNGEERIRHIAYIRTYLLTRRTRTVGEGRGLDREDGEQVRPEEVVGGLLILFFLCVFVVKGRLLLVDF